MTLLEETLASTLSALDSSQAAQLALQQRVAELESQHSRLGNGADATTQTEFDVEGLEESLLLSALGGVQEATVRNTVHRWRKWSQPGSELN